MTRKVQRGHAREQNKRTHQDQGASLDVAEAYSQPRLTKVAGYKAGFAIDLRTGWDLSKPEVQRDALKLLEEQKPWLLMVSPPCKWFSTLQVGTLRTWDSNSFEQA